LTKLGCLILVHRVQKQQGRASYRSNEMMQSY